MDGFIKGDGSGIHLTGKQKIAILLSEIYKGSSQDFLKQLNLTTKEIQQIRKATENLGSYNPGNAFEVKRETMVLEELEDFARMHNFYEEGIHQVPKENHGKNSQLYDMIGKDPQAVVQLLRSWMDN